MVFGLVNAPATFQRTMDRLLAEIKGEECFIYHLDDIIIFNRDIADHRRRLRNLLEKLQGGNLRVNIQKCTYAQSSVKYLGHVVTSDGLKPDPNKVRAIREYPCPTAAKEIEGFLGLAGYYRRFIPKFSEVAEPLTKLLRKAFTFQRGRPQEIARGSETLCAPS